MLNIVRSRQHNDCGVCAIACATGVSWEEADEAIFGAVKPSNRATTGAKLARGLPLGWNALTPRLKGLRIKDYQGWPDIPVLPICMQRAIVNVHYADSRYGHWVVWDGEAIYDSNFALPENEQRYPYKPLGYLLLEPEL